MRYKSGLKLLFAFCVLLSTFTFAEEQELLKRQDIGKIIQQILAEHLGKQQVSPAIVKNALKIYINQFDPDRIYLLDSEIRPFINLSDNEVNELISKYKGNDYSIYEKLNDVIQKSILRSREYRRTLEANKAQLFQTAITSYVGFPKQAHFPANLEELKERMREHYSAFIHAEKKHYGDSYIMRNESPIVEIYERHLRSIEDQYLYTDEHDRPLSLVEKDNLFSMHVLKSLASSLDSHTEFFTPAEAFDMRVHLEKNFQGIGITLQETPEGIVVSHLTENGPAAKSGLIKVNDAILEVDGKSVSGEDIGKVMEMLRGAANSSVTLQLSRSSKPFMVTLKREPIVLNNDRVDMSYETFGNGIIGKITLHSFYQGDNGITSENDVRDAIEKLEKIGHLRGLILDLRDNTGGFLTQAVKVASLFITNGIVVISKYSNGEEHFFRDMNGKATYNGPLIVLTSKLTASAAEIVAQALQDYGVAVIVGDEHTYGKGTIQTQTVTQNKSASYFKVTVGKYYTVSGKTPQIQGVKADVVVPGIYSNEQIGEQYVESQAIRPDTIPAAYNDPLKDIDPSMRSWYLRYYVPTLQHKLDTWQPLISTLKKNSAYRITNNKNYQTFLKKLKGEKDEDKDIEDEFGISDSAQKNFGKDDLQMNEAVNVLKDMIYLQSNLHGNAATVDAHFENSTTK